MKKYFVPLLLTMLSLVPLSVGAQSLSISISKGLFDFDLLPGSPQDGVVGIINTSLTQAMPVHAQLTLWNLKEDSDDMEFVTAEPELNAVKWFFIETDIKKKIYEPFGGRDFIIDPDHSKDIHFRITPPKSAALGTYLVSMRFQVNLPDSSFNEKGPHVLPEIDALFFLKVGSLSLDALTNPNQYRAEIISLFPAEGNKTLADTLTPKAYAGVFDNIVKELVLKIRNNGLYYFKTSGTVEVRNWFGRVVSRIPLPGRYLIPNHTRSFTIPAVDAPAPTGFWSSIASWLTSQLYLGPYTATVVLQYPLAASGQPDFKTGVFAQNSVHFWIFPWKLLLMIIFLAALSKFLYQRTNLRWRLAWRALIKG